MAVNRQQQFLGQGRLDTGYLRSLESAVCFDFDVLGQILAGDLPAVAKGFDVVTTGAIGAPASNLVVNVAGALVVHGEASESGTFFTVPADRAAEVLGPTNGRVRGGFVAGATNYVGVDLVRLADAATTDVQKFISDDPESSEEASRQVPLARTVDYRFTISTVAFNATPNVLPVAIVTTDASTHVTAVVDARHLLFRQGRGGASPAALNPYSWPLGRTEAQGGDRAIQSFRTWMQAAMTRLWELGGGAAWYAPTADRNVTMTGAGPVFSNGQYAEWDGTNVHWQGMTFLFDNSPGRYNTVADQTGDLAGLTDLADGDCIYVDLDRTANRSGGTALQAAKAPLSSLGTSAVPGGRQVMIWRQGIYIFTRGQVQAVGQANSPPATTTTLGTVKLTATPPVPGAPVVPTVDAGGRAMATGLTRSSSGTLTVGSQANDTSVAIGSSSSTGTTVTGAAGTALSLIGMQGLELSLTTDTTAPATDKARQELRTNGLTTPNTRYQVGWRWPDGTFTVVAESEAF